MKTVLRTLTILSAALAIVAALIGFSQLSYTQPLRQSTTRDGPAREGNQPLGTFATRPAFEAANDNSAATAPRQVERGGHGDRGSNVRGLRDVGNNLFTIALCIIVIGLGERVWRRVRRLKGEG